MVGVIGNAHVVNDRHNVQIVGQRNLRAVAEVAVIARLQASTLSLMPQGLETTMTRQELADLIAFLKR